MILVVTYRTRLGFAPVLTLFKQDATSEDASAAYDAWEGRTRSPLRLTGRVEAVGPEREHVIKPGAVRSVAIFEDPS